MGKILRALARYKKYIESIKGKKIKIKLNQSRYLNSHILIPKKEPEQSNELPPSLSPVEVYINLIIFLIFGKKIQIDFSVQMSNKRILGLDFLKCPWHFHTNVRQAKLAFTCRCRELEIIY